MLDHLIATKRNIAGRYMLGELSPARTGEIRRALFQLQGMCRGRAGLVGRLLEFESRALPDAGLRRAGCRNGQSDRTGSSRFAFAPQPAYVMASALALCVLTVVTTLQSISLRGQLVPQAVAEFALHPDARGEEIEIGAQQTGQFLVLSADVPLAAPKLQWQVRGVASQTPLMEGAAPGPTPGSPFCLLIPASKLSTWSVCSRGPAGWNTAGNQRGGPV